MKSIITINQRGTLTLPKEIREKYNLQNGGQLIVEEAEEGIVLRLAATFPLETYSDERVQEFSHQNQTELSGFKLP
jgi:AbrB family looped-hinge helix DNA binding protein